MSEKCRNKDEFQTLTWTLQPSTPNPLIVQPKPSNPNLLTLLTHVSYDDTYMFSVSSQLGSQSQIDFTLS